MENKCMATNLSYENGVISMTTGQGDSISPEIMVNASQVTPLKIFSRDAEDAPEKYYVALQYVNVQITLGIMAMFMGYIAPTSLILNGEPCEDAEQFMDWYQDASDSGGNGDSGNANGPYNMIVNNANTNFDNAMELENTAPADLDAAEDRSTPAIRFGVNTLVEGVSTKVYIRLRLVGVTARGDARIVIEVATKDPNPAVPLAWMPIGGVVNDGTLYLNGQGSFGGGLYSGGATYLDAVNPSMLKTLLPVVIHPITGEILKRADPFPIKLDSKNLMAQSAINVVVFTIPAAQLDPLGTYELDWSMYVRTGTITNVTLAFKAPGNVAQSFDVPRLRNSNTFGYGTGYGTGITQVFRASNQGDITLTVVSTGTPDFDIFTLLSQIS